MDRRGRPKRITSAPQAALQAYFWKVKDHLSNRDITLNLGPEAGKRFEKLSLPDIPFHNSWATDQFWHRTAGRYVRDGEALWRSGKWKIALENAIQTGAVSLGTGKKTLHLPMTYRVFVMCATTKRMRNKIRGTRQK